LHGPKASCYMGSRSPPTHLKRQFWWIGAPIVNYTHFLSLAVQKRLNRSIWLLDSSGPKDAQIQSYSPNGANVPSWEDMLPSLTCRITVKHPSTAAVRLMPNYFDHLSSLDTPTETVAQIAERFEPNTILWAFHTMQPSSCILFSYQSENSLLSTLFWTSISSIL